MKYFFIIFIFFFTFSGASQTRNVIFIGGKEQVCSLSRQVEVGIVKERGKGITRNTQSSNSKNHCESLTSVGIILKSK